MRPPIRRLAASLALVVAGAWPAAARADVGVVPAGSADRAAAAREAAASGMRVIGVVPAGLLVDAGDGPLRGRARPLQAAEKLRAPRDGRPAAAWAVHPVPGRSTSDLAAALAAAGLADRARLTAGDRFVTVDGPLTRGAAGAIAARGDVLAVVAVPEVEPLLDVARGLLQTRVPRLETLHDLGVAGQGEIVAICDSGLAVATCAFDDPGVPHAVELVDPSTRPTAVLTSPEHRKVQAYQHHSMSDATDGDAGVHGTSVAAAAAGDAPRWCDEPPVPHPDAIPVPAPSEPWDGHAPGARLVVQDIQPAAGGAFLVPSALANWVEAAWLAGARTWNASWASSGGGVYDHFARELDVASARHPDLVLVVAAGNTEGAGQVTAPATARNALAVGAAMAFDPYVEDVFFTSSQGPTVDGRLKPDVVAPGAGIDLHDGQSPCAIRRTSGTSIAAPAGAAAAALVRQWLREGRESGGRAGGVATRDPSAALVRALIVLGARSLRGGPDVRVVERPAPSPEQGFGAIVLGEVLHAGGPPRLRVLADDDLASGSDGFAAGATTPAAFPLIVQDGSQPLSVVMAFADAVPAPLATSAIVNDLDLEVVAPSGATLAGNDLVDGASVPGGMPDPLNNVEIVKLQPPVEVGAWTVRVVPRSVLVGPQPFALAAVGGPCAAAGPFGAGVARESRCATLSVAAPRPGGSEPLRFDAFRATTPGGQDFMAPIARGLPRPALFDAGLAAGTYHYVFEATDACGQVLRSPEITGVVTGACPLEPTLFVTKGPSGTIVLSWDDGSPRDVLRHPVPGAVAGGPVVGTGVATFVEPMPEGSYQFYLVR